MSTYLLAFAVSQFRNTTDFSDVDFSVFASNKARSNMQYALDTGIRALKVLEEFVGAPYQLTKMDFIAIDDFLMGAMVRRQNFVRSEFSCLRISGELGSDKLQVNEYFTHY